MKFQNCFGLLFNWSDRESPSPHFSHHNLWNKMSHHNLLSPKIIIKPHPAKLEMVPGRMGGCFQCCFFCLTRHNPSPVSLVEGKKINIYSTHIYMLSTVFRVFLYISSYVIHTTTLWNQHYLPLANEETNSGSLSKLPEITQLVRY